MKPSPIWVAVAAALLPLGAAVADDDARVQTLLDRLEQQEARVKVLERKLEIQDENAKIAAQSTPIVKASSKGFSFQSADGANVVKLRGTLHFDHRSFLDDATPETADTWVLRR